MEIDEEDCSEDLYADIFVPPKKPRLEDSILDEQYQKLLKENEELKQKLKKLEKENKNYSTNISALYLTAKSEIDKKNFTIKNLSERLKNLTQSKFRLSKEEADEMITRCQEALMESQNQITLQEIKRSLKSLSPNTVGRRKHIKFGNMSVYFFRDQIGFQREETVTFKDDKLSKKLTEPQTAGSASPSVTTEVPVNNNPNREVENNNSARRLSSDSSRTSGSGDMSTKEPLQHHDGKNDSDRRSQRSSDKEDRDRNGKGNSAERNNISYRRNSREHTPPPLDRRKDDDRHYQHRKEIESGNRKIDRERDRLDRGSHRYDNRTRSSRRHSNSSYNSDGRRYNR